MKPKEFVRCGRCAKYHDSLTGSRTFTVCGFVKLCYPCAANERKIQNQLRGIPNVQTVKPRPCW